MLWSFDIRPDWTFTLCKWLQVAFRSETIVRKSKLVIACIWLKSNTPSINSTITSCEHFLLHVLFICITIFHWLAVLSDCVLKSVDLFLHYFFFPSKLKKVILSKLFYSLFFLIFQQLLLKKLFNYYISLCLFWYVAKCLLNQVIPDYYPCLKIGKMWA